MGQLYLNEYAKNLVGKRVCIACREGILRDNFREIIADIKFLTKNGVETTLFQAVNIVKKKASLPYGRDAFSRLSGAMLDDLAH